MPSNSGTLVVVCSGVPFPPVDGGRVDVWRRLCVLARLGYRIHVLFWASSREELAVATSALSEIGVQPLGHLRQRRLRDYLRLFARHPARMEGYSLSSDEYARTLDVLTQAQPDIVLQEGWESFLTADRLARDLSLPRIYRSQNVEHRYWRGQLALATGLRKLPFVLALPTLFAIELRMRSTAELILDISEEDRDWWASQGHRQTSLVLPPNWELQVEEPAAAPETWLPHTDVFYGGNLHTPNALDGVRWFINDVLPLLREKDTVTVRIAGSLPPAQLEAECAANSVECIANPRDMRPFWRLSAVLINPVRHSSGVNVKMLEMIASGLAIVSTTAGARGLPMQLRPFVTIADEPAAFAAAVRSSMHRETSDVDLRMSALADACGPDRLREVLTPYVVASRRRRGVVPHC